MTLAYINTVRISSNLTIYDFGSFSAASDGLLIAVISAGRGGSTSVASVTIGGSAAALNVNPTTSRNAVGIASREVAAGSHNVTVTLSTGCLNGAVSVFLLTGYSSAIPADTDSQETASGTSLGLSLDFPTNGIAVYGVICEATGDITWSAASEDADATIESPRAGAAAHKTASGAGNTETVSFASSAAAAVAAVWAPAAAGAKPWFMHACQQVIGGPA